MTDVLANNNTSLRPLALLCLGVLIARVIYLIAFCRYDLIEDEAQYWVWAQHLDWSYYSKGPGVAWAIWLSTQIFGNAEWAVRLPTAIAGSIGMFAAGSLVRDMIVWSRQRVPNRAYDASSASPARAALFAGAAYALAPALQMAGILMTIDSPYVACWAICCWAAFRALAFGQSWAWLIFGLAFAIGFLFKYTILLLIPGVLYFAIRHRRSLAKGSAPMLAIGMLLAALGLVPVLIWNAQNDWQTVRHLLGHIGAPGGDVPQGSTSDPWSPAFLPVFVVSQLGIAGPLLLLAVFAAWRSFRSAQNAPSEREDWLARSYLLACAAPILLFYLAISIFVEAEGNWALGAYATLLPLAGWYAADAFARRSAADRIAAQRRFLWNVGLTYGLVGALFLHTLTLTGDALLALNRNEWFKSTFTSVSGREPRDPVGRLRGADAMSRHLAIVVHRAWAETGKRPFVVFEHYGRTSQMTYYLRPDRWPMPLETLPLASVPAREEFTGPFRIISAMSFVGGRKSQFDMWDANPFDNPDLIGRPAIIMTSGTDRLDNIWRPKFSRIARIPEQRLRGEHKTDRLAYIAYDFRGLGQSGGKDAAVRSKAP